MRWLGCGILVPRLHRKYVLRIQETVK